MLARGTPKTPFSLKNFIAGMTCPTPGAPCIPRRWRPQLPAHPDRLHSTGSREGRARCKGRPCKARHARSDAGHAAPVCTQYQTGHAGQIRTVQDAGGRGACPKLCRYGQHNFTILCQKNKSEKSYIFTQKVLTYKIYLI